MSKIVDEFRQGLANGQLLIQTCKSCGTNLLYPRFRCISCGSNELDWTVASGEGTLHSYTVVRAIAPTGFEDELPYALAVVKLVEGVQLLARLLPEATGDWGHYKCDMTVVLKSAPQNDTKKRPVAWFGPADS